MEMAMKSTALRVEMFAVWRQTFARRYRPIISAENQARQETSRSWWHSEHSPSGSLLGPLAENGPFHSSLQASTGLHHSSHLRSALLLLLCYVA